MDPIEQEIQAKGLTAPRVTPEDVEKSIKSVYFHLVPGTTHMMCILTLDNGFTVTGESACASPENFDVDLGAKIARADATKKIWPLLGFRLIDRLHQAKKEGNH